MFKLKPLLEKKRKEYIDEIRPGLVNRIINGRTVNGKKIWIPKKIKSVLIPGWDTQAPDYKIIDRLLTAEPEQLIELNNNLWKKFNINATQIEKTRQKIETLFNYDGVFNTSSKSKGFWLAKLIERKTCPYCNRQYCFTVEKDGGKNSKQRIVRPSFDHWFLKSKYPLLSLSLHNLIPSCASCNSSVRGTTELDLHKHIHPYVSYDNEPQSETDFRFRASKKCSDRFSWQLRIERKPGSRIDNTIKAFALDEIYSYHEDLEVRDIMMFDARYKDRYLETLFKNTIKHAGFRLSKEEVYRMLFGTQMNEERFLERPFSKLKHDLLIQIGVIKNKP